MYDVTKKDYLLALKGLKAKIHNSAEEKIVVMFIENKVDLPDKVITSEMGAKFVARVDGASYNLVPKQTKVLIVFDLLL